MKTLIDIVKSYKDEEISAEEVVNKVENYIRLNLSKKSSKLPKFNFYKYAGDDISRPQLNGVCFENGYKIASDAHIVVKLESDYDKEFEGKLIDKEGRVIDTKHPNYDAVIPKPDEKYEVGFDFNKAEFAIKTSRINKKVGKLNKDQMLINFNGVYLRANLFELFTIAYKQIENPKMYLLGIGGCRASQLFVSGDNGCCLLMPMLLTEEKMKESGSDYNVSIY